MRDHSCNFNALRAKGNSTTYAILRNPTCTVSINYSRACRRLNRLLERIVGNGSIVRTKDYEEESNRS